MEDLWGICPPSPGLGAGLTPPSVPSAPQVGLHDKMAAKQPPPLMKKHSQTDLVSRLKTRKVLGVGGEDDDGEVHRSKVGTEGPGEPVALGLGSLFWNLPCVFV